MNIRQRLSQNPYRCGSRAYIVPSENRSNLFIPYLKESFKFESRIEQVFEQYLYNPVVDFVMVKSRKAKLIQTGSIHAYLGYIFGILILLFMFVIAGGN